MNERLNDLEIENSLFRVNDVSLDFDIRSERVQSFYEPGNDVIAIFNYIIAGRFELLCKICITIKAEI